LATYPLFLLADLRDVAMNYQPGNWAKASTLLAALGWFIQLWIAARRGADLSQGAIINIFVALMLAVIPMLLGTICFYAWRRSRRAGDIAFALTMAAQGAALAVAGATMK
jgi:cytochrome bd-type quinol oxidase subunit 2